MNYCTDCGSQLKESAKFCKECGAETNVEIVASSVEVTAVEQTHKTADRQQASAQAKPSAAEESFFNFLEFFKQAVIHPTSVFSQMDWINGIISLAVFTLIQATVLKEVSAYSLSQGIIHAPLPFLPTWIQNMLLQAVIVGLLFVVNKLVFRAPVSIKNVVTEYGGMMAVQSALLILAAVFGLVSEAGKGIVMIVAMLNQLNIITMYLFANRERGTRKLDGYYQIILSYFALTVLTSLLLGSVG
ncbi:zinc ribbon domain-containing protein [Atopococcus tabaci]|uniref:zinc ribbon domain-containing protein n=1 Tax=Atopococcus tabaci TaxID=269774 RepID=UPI0003F658F0|nr:zinc ribbon domain-containing protein [Atopococcus tabaci]